MSVDAKKTCNTHTKEKEEKGECCQEEQDRAEQGTYEHRLRTESKPKSVSYLLQEGMELQRRLENE